jgi:hypothetical protein
VCQANSSRKVKLILAYVLRASRSGDSRKYLAIGNGFGIGSDRLVGIVPKLKIFDHSLA